MNVPTRRLEKIRSFTSPEQGLRVINERAPQAEAWAAAYFEALRPFAARLYALRRRIATAAIAVFTCLLFVHVMFGANGMVVYKQKKAEYQSLRTKITDTESENQIYQRQIQALKTDTKAIEKEAREQLRYARPGEYVYVPSVTASPSVSTHSAKK
ncbi:MAG TPA: septum formation initiator family protein [Candidatus Binatia bacterium]|nr:septum formation initiator family protein [Candidatus Binatia bacterium]